jgi:hypothetical protein
MALVTRTVTGTCQDANGSPYVEKPVYFSPVSVFGADGILVSTESIKVLTDEAGVFEVDLYTVDTEDAFVRYAGILPGGEQIVIDLADGEDDITLAELIDQSNLSNPDLTATLNAMQALIDTHAAVMASDDVLGHVKVDGVTIVIDEDGVISVAS